MCFSEDKVVRTHGGSHLHTVSRAPSSNWLLRTVSRGYINEVVRHSEWDFG